ncbi:hypothetical protein [Escherichia phage SUSP2]|uniref:Uncharacterized protein n=2 Tax=Mooglevirus TaxID=1985303 RepID=A0A0N9S9B4_9CAUD|nr:hypothetical protein AVU07_agp037 [Escherichia phage phiSUSP1]YP_009211073.1 hypothetical protein AVU06_gp038 [Escherichia phage SUSP2]ALH47067.1 hypothetical protein [Escherichia phage phiSUSP1]ALH47198.1 hypothetical protein [Escherichia phage SUSP2]
MKKLMVGVILATLSFGASAMKMPEADFSKVSMEACQIVRKVVTDAGELTKPLSSPTVIEMSDRITDYKYRVMADYYEAVSDAMVTQDVDLLDSKSIEKVSDTESEMMDETFKGVHYFVEKRTCVGL